jgi:hypothetical protein
MIVVLLRKEDTVRSAARLDYDPGYHHHGDCEWKRQLSRRSSSRSAFCV